ncbi:uncharacterized protein LOC117340800 [Pecten maximus]|uniref:uncharacterized protein LOC117340800 n=1 Tax=Pecten maximus TaxID=6579 RepID=UPI0014586C86|nr:uncharacterized protein LOC117340800 [Pecten maximus]
MMDLKSTHILAILFTCVLGDTTHLCDDIAHLDCNTYLQGDTDEKVCDNRHVLYHNFCEFSKAKCADNSITVASLGGCFGNHPVEIYTTTGPSITTPTPGPSITTPTPDPILAVFCQNKDSITCPASLSPVCASNGQLYFNQCDFSLAYCNDTSLTLQDPNNCHH